MGRAASFDGAPLSGLGLFEWMVDLLGKPQSWYTRLNTIQNDLTIALAEITSFGRASWEAIQQSIAQMISEGNQSAASITFPGYDFCTEDIPAQVKTIIVTKEHTPTDQEVSTAESRATLYKKAVGFAKEVDSVSAARAEAESAVVKSNLAKSELRSPEEVGVEVFEEELKKRAKALVGGGLEVLMPALLAIGGILVLTILAK
jgi:hypothetical protein